MLADRHTSVDELTLDVGERTGYEERLSREFKVLIVNKQVKFLRDFMRWAP